MKSLKIAEHAKDKKMMPELDEYDELTKTLLANRNIKTKEEAKRFLKPDYERDTYDPFLILGMEKGVDRILDAIDSNEKIVVYADYDCDGIPGGVLLHDLFKKIGYQNVDIYIPHRHDEGYGLNKNAIKQFAGNGTKLIITVDCGITDVEEVVYANELGMDVIITDHHLLARTTVQSGGPQEIIPPAYVIIDSKQKQDNYPDKELCGGGVAFKLSQAVLRKGKSRGKFLDIPDGWEKWLLDMAGLSTIADMVPLRNENRTLAHFGLAVLRKSRKPGLKSLLKKMRIDQSHLTEDDIGFMIAPRINAAGRMDHPIEAFRLLATDDKKTADELAEYLHNINETRKGLVARIVKEARGKIKDRDLRDVLVVGSQKWQPGVLGLVANKLMEDYDRPTFVWGRGQAEHIKGSCRSNGSINVVELMTSVKEGVFLDVGGHEFSGGFSVSHEQIHYLEEELLSSHEKVAQKESGRETIIADAELSLDDVTWATYKKIEKFAPFGMGNPKPLFLFKNIEIGSVSHFGKEKNHLKLMFHKQAGGSVEAIAFFAVSNDFCGVSLQEGGKIYLAANIEKSVFRGRPELRLRMEYVKKVDE